MAALVAALALAAAMSTTAERSDLEYRVPTILLKTSETKDEPGPADIVPRELAYSFKSGKLFIRRPDGGLDVIGGRGVNHKPIVAAVLATVSEAAASISGNVLTTATDPDGDALTVVSISYGVVPKTVGTSFATVYGTMVMSATGAFTFSPNSTARTLRTGQSASEIFSFKAADGQGGNTVASLSITVIGQDDAPQALADFFGTPYNVAVSFNVLTNDINLDGGPMTVSSYSVEGVVGDIAVGTSTLIDGVGTVVINANGAGTFTPVSGYSGIVPAIGYTETNGYLTATGQVMLTVSPPPAEVGANPVTTAMTGDRTFHIGPGQEYLDLDTFPWTTLQAGDAVNIHYRPTPYNNKVGLFGIGTALRRIYIHGVTDSSGNRPVIDGDGARTAAGCMTGPFSVFGAGNESFGVITLKPLSWAGTRPCYFTIQNLELRGARPGGTCYDLDGTARTWGFSAGIWLQPATDIVIRNNVVEDNGLGLFTNSQGGGDIFGCERIKMLYNRMSGNGEVGDDHQHNVYMQAYDVLVEGNYLGVLRVGSYGSAYKSRSGKEVIRGNWIEGRSSLLDMVQADGYFDGMVTKPDYGKSWVYSNVLLTADALGGVSYRLVHFGGDNQGEQDADFPVVPSPANYRTHLLFWNNTVVSKATTGGQQYLFKLSFIEQVCDAWDNIFYQPGSRSLHWMHYSGTLNLRGTNLAYSPTSLTDWAPETGGQMMSVNKLGTLLTLDPTFTNPDAYDFSLVAGSPALNRSSGLPAGVQADLYEQFPLALEPWYRSNGVFLRPVSGLTDLGAFEYMSGSTVRSAPAMITRPAISASSFSPGSVLTVSDGAWLYSPTSFSYQWQYRATTADAWTNVGTNVNTHTATTVGFYSCLVSATNAINTTTERSVAQEITAVPPATIVQFKVGTRPVPADPVVTIAPDLPPVVGHTLVVFTTAVDSISDNFGNTWAQIIDVPTLSYDSADNIGDQVWVSTITATGDGFVVNGIGTNPDRQTGLLYETDGTVDGNQVIVGAWAPTTGYMDITVSGELVLAGHRAANGYGVTTYATLETPPFTFDGFQPDGRMSQHGSWHAHAASAGVGALTVNQQNVAYGAFFTTCLVSILPPA